MFLMRCWSVSVGLARTAPSDEFVLVIAHLAGMWRIAGLRYFSASFAAQDGGLLVGYIMAVSCEALIL